MTRLPSWVSSANQADTDFPLNNLPYGVFSTHERGPRCGVAIGDCIFDCQQAEADGWLRLGAHDDLRLFDKPSWNALMQAGSAVWAQCREQLTQLLSLEQPAQEALASLLVSRSTARLHLPLQVAEYTDFYAGRHHATNIGTMVRGAEHALPPNWLHIPIGYNGRASSVVVSDTPVRRPWGQLKSPHDALPRWAPSQRFDLELELGAIVGTPSDGPLSVAQAFEHLFGYVLLNDWSARDIQVWEYAPLGPFQAKATATTISPWIVTAAALEPFRCDTPPRDIALLPHLQDCGPMSYDIDLAIGMTPKGQAETLISRTNTNQLYYSAAQQLAHHSSSGCPMRSADLLGSGTISGAQRHQCGSLMELSWGGTDPLTLDCGSERRFIEDGDTLTLYGAARAEDYHIGFGACRGLVLPALTDPYSGAI